MKKFIARKKTATKTVAVLNNADVVFITFSAKKVKTQSLIPKNEAGTIWLKSLVPGVIEDFDGELCLPSDYRAVFCGDKLYIKHTEETIHIWKISKK